MHGPIFAHERFGSLRITRLRILSTSITASVTTKHTYTELLTITNSWCTSAEGNGMSLSIPVRVNNITRRNVTIFFNIPILLRPITYRIRYSVTIAYCITRSVISLWCLAHSLAWPDFYFSVLSAREPEWLYSVYSSVSHGQTVVSTWPYLLQKVSGCLYCRGNR